MNQTMAGVSTRETEKQQFDQLRATIDSTKPLLNTLVRRLSKDSTTSPTIQVDLLDNLSVIARRAEAFGILISKTKPSGSTGKGQDGDRGKKRKAVPGDEEGGRITEGPAPEREKRKDVVDSEGVQLWNQSLQLKQSAAWPNAQIPPAKPSQITDWHVLLSSLKLASFHLLSASTDTKPKPPLILRLLVIASKTAVELVFAGRVNEGMEIMGKAAVYEDTLRKLAEKDKALLHSKGTTSLGHGFERERRAASMDYYLARVDIETTRDNPRLAMTMLKKSYAEITLDGLDVRELMRLASKCYHIGIGYMPNVSALEPKGASEQTSKKPSDKDGDDSMKGLDGRGEGREDEAGSESLSLAWLRQAGTIIEQLELKPGGIEKFVGAKDLKVAVHCSLAKALLMEKAQGTRNALDAEAILDDLLKDKDVQAAEDTQRIRFMQLMVYNRKSSSTAAILDVLQDIVNHMIFDEANVKRLISEVSHLAKSRPDIFVPAILNLLKSALALTEDEQHVHASRIFLTLVLHCQSKATSDPAEQVRVLKSALALFAGNVAIKKVMDDSARACVTLLWKMADSVAKLAGGEAKQYAAKLVLLALDRAFTTTTKAENDKIHRRAACFYLQGQRYAEAQDEIGKTPQDQAHTQLLIFLVAMKQDSALQAASAVEALAACADVTGSHLQLVLNESTELGDASLITTSLRALISKMRGLEKGSFDVIRGFRCLLRMETLSLRSSGAKLDVKTATRVLDAFGEALDGCRRVTSTTAASVHPKDLAWFYKTLFNLMIQGLRTWDDEGLILRGLDLALEWMAFYRELSLPEPDPKLESQMLLLQHAAVCGTIISARNEAVEARKIALFTSVIHRIETCTLHIKDMDPDKALKELDELREVQLAFLLESRLAMQDWEGLTKLIETLRSERIPTHIWEAAAQATVQESCPIRVQHVMLAGAVNALIEHYADGSKVCKWLRAIIEFLLHRRSANDLAEAMAFAKKAQTCLAQSKETYPQEEGEWMLASTWNLGLELCGVNQRREALEWLEISLNFATALPVSEAQRERMVAYYTETLASSKTNACANVLE